MRCLDPRTLIVVVESFPFLFNGTRVHGEQMSAAIGLEDGGQLGVVDASAGGEHCSISHLNPRRRRHRRRYSSSLRCQRESQL